MTRQVPSGYTSSPEKDVIREHFDLPLVRRLHKSKKRPLAYFGLPGVEALDLRVWRSMLSKAVAVERNSYSCKMMQETLDSRLPELQYSVFEGEVDETILLNKGREQESGGRAYSVPVGNVYDASVDEYVWHFDVVYLDYFGPFLPGKKSSPSPNDWRRAKALRRLFEGDRLDAWDPWLLLLTVDTKMSQHLKSQLQSYLRKAKPKYSRKTSEALDFMLSGPPDSAEGNARLICGSYAILISSAASSANLTALPRGTVLYRGSGRSDMIHLVCELRPDSDPLGNPPDPLSLLRSPFLVPKVSGSPWVELMPDQCPGVNRGVVKNSLGFLGRESVDKVVSGFS